jgi:hypothetical protein
MLSLHSSKQSAEAYGLFRRRITPRPDRGDTVSTSVEPYPHSMRAQVIFIGYQLVKRARD